MSDSNKLEIPAYAPTNGDTYGYPQGYYFATIIADSLPKGNEKNGARLTTMQLIYPRFIHGQMLTHRAFSRNSSSSRAIPVSTMISQVENRAVFPLQWGSNKPGMQAGEEVDVVTRSKAWAEWDMARMAAIKHAKNLADLGIHKQVVNRLLEPFQLMRTIVTATDWDNFFKLRVDDAAQPEIQALARLMQKALKESEPKVTDLHIPYVHAVELEAHGAENAKMLSAARCARVSYLNHDNSKPDVGKDMELAKRLYSEMHLSPFEHQATPQAGYNFNLRDWKSQRYDLQMS